MAYKPAAATATAATVCNCYNHSTSSIMIQSMTNTFAHLAIGQSANQFTDVDGSAITRGPDDGIVRTFTVTSPHGTKNQAKTVTVLLIDWPTDAARLRCALDAMVSGPGVVATVDGVHVCGFDTESDTVGNVELIQLSMGSTCVLLRRGSRLFGDATLRLFFLNELYPEMKIVFSGAELATADALDMLQLDVPIKGLLDLTPVFWNKKAKKIEFKAADGLPRGLRNMFVDVFGIEWHKDKTITKSDWGLPTLTLPQLKYAVLDAWTSAMLGLHVFRDRRDDGIYKMVFSTANHDALMARAVEGELLAKQVVRQAKELEDMQKREPKCADVCNMRIAQNSNDKKLDIICSGYGNRVHINIGRVEIRVISPGGSPRGVSVWATVDESKGKMSTIELEPHLGDTLQPYNAVDLRRLADLKQSTAKKVVDYWRSFNNQFGAYAHQYKNRRERERAAAAYIRVMVFTHDKPDPLLTQVRSAVSAMVRSNFVPLDFFPEGLRARVSVERNSIKDLRLPGAADSGTVYTLAWNVLRGMKFYNSPPRPLSADQETSIALHLEALNAAQGAALANAFKHKLSVIKGPPGTGKTRTIAAIADVALTGNLRVLIVAPGNSASRRILESLVKTGFEEACLVVAESYFFEWHEDAYTAEEQKLGPYVHTKCTFDDEMRGAGVKQMGRRAEDRETVDFRNRKERAHDNKWLEAAKGEDKEASSKPVVVIGTHGTIALNGTANKGAPRSWSAQVQNLLAIQSIDMIIVDETSQLWSGHSLPLLASLPSLKHIVLVGDEDQLAPYGEDQVRHLKSLFAAALVHPSVPRAVLGVTYRLPPPMAELLSKVIYNGAIVSQRDAAADDLFLDHTEELLGELCLVRHSNSSFDISSLLNRLLEDDGSSDDEWQTFPSLAWVHVQGAAHSSEESKSKGNDTEAQVVVSCVGQLLVGLHALAPRYPSGPDNPSTIKVVILTGYLEQKAVLERALAQTLQELRYRGMGDVEIVDWIKSSMIVNTVDSFQGQEAEIVFVSTVRSLASEQLKGLGFAKDQRRANVMLSRFSQLMVVVGDADNMAQAGGGQQLLLPKLAWWCSDNNSMFEMTGDASGALRPYHLPAQYAAAQRTIPVRQGQPAARAVAPPPSAAVVQPPPRSVTPLAANGFSGLTPFAQAVVGVLQGRPLLQMNLSQLAGCVPRSLWAGRGSLLVPVREVRCVSLRLERSEWVATLVLAGEEEAPSGTTSVGSGGSFAQKVVAALGAVKSKRMTLSALSTRIPAADLGLKKFSELLQQTVGDRTEINGGWISLRMQGSSGFAERVVSLLGTVSRGGMHLSTLGGHIPPFERPSVTKKLKALLQEELGEVILIQGDFVRLRQKQNRRNRRSRRRQLPIMF